LYKSTLVAEFSRGFYQFFYRHEPNCGEIPYPTMLKNPSEIPASGSGFGRLL